jgi:hypothetical protein
MRTYDWIRSHQVARNSIEAKGRDAQSTRADCVSLAALTEVINELLVLEAIALAFVECERLKLTGILP